MAKWHVFIYSVLTANTAQQHVNLLHCKPIKRVVTYKVYMELLVVLDCIEDGSIFPLLSSLVATGFATTTTSHTAGET